MDEWGRDEAELVRRCREGSEAAYAALVRQHRPRLYALAYRLLLDREAAEDVVQETFLSAFRQIERFEPRPSIAAWLNTIVLRTASRAASRQRARPKSSIDASIAGAGAGDWDGDALALADPDPTADPLAAVEAADLRRAVGPPSPPCRSSTARPSCCATSWASTTRRPPAPSTSRSTRSRATSCAGRSSSARRSRPSWRLRRRHRTDDGEERRDRDGRRRRGPDWPARRR